MRRGLGHLRVAILLGSLAVVLSSSSAWAQEEDEQAEARVVQKRKFVLGHEFFAAAGWLPMDAFEKGITATGGYALHFTDSIALELAFTKSFTYETSLRDELLALGVSPTPFEVIDYFASGVVTWSPFYGKLAIGVSSLAHIDFSLSAGGGYAWLTSSSAPMAEWGFGFRLYISSVLSARLDARSIHILQGSLSSLDLQNELFVALGIALSAGG